MSQVKQEQPSMLARAEDIQRQIHELSSRDMQLWSIVSLVILVLTGGFLALIAPNLVWTQRIIRVEQAYLPQLFFGLICKVRRVLPSPFSKTLWRHQPWPRPRDSSSSSRS